MCSRDIRLDGMNELGDTRNHYSVEGISNRDDSTGRPIWKEHLTMMRHRQWRDAEDRASKYRMMHDMECSAHAQSMAKIQALEKELEEFRRLEVWYSTC